MFLCHCCYFNALQTLHTTQPPQAFPNANDLILDSEILLVDTNTGEQLPFGSLGKHKKNAFQTAEVCLFVFDCIYYNGEDLTKKYVRPSHMLTFVASNRNLLKNLLMCLLPQTIERASQDP